MNLVKVGLITAPESFWEAPADVLEAICNGCGAKGIQGKLVPDTIWFLRVTPA